MRIWQKTSITLVILLFTFVSLFAQSNFEGRIVYTITYTDLPDEMKGYESMLPKDVKIHMKGNKSRVEQSQMMGTNVVVSDMDQKSGFLEMDVNGQKFRILVSTAQFEEEATKMSNIEYVDESKQIAGYHCKKAIMKDDDGNVVMSVFFTDKIQNKAQMEFVGLKGFPLEYSMSQQNIKMKMTASVVSEESVSDELFEKSEGYQDISEADLQKMMMGGG